jgi:hypothetical protein
VFPEEHDQTISFTDNFHVASAGETLKMLSDVSLTGKTVQAVIVSPIGLRSTVAGTVSTDGTYAYITTTASTFPYPGTYQIMLQQVNEDSSFTDADPFTVTVVPSL